MSKVRVHIAVSADGYVAGPNQSEENPLGEGGGSLHDWAFALKAFREPDAMEGGEVNASTPVVEEALANVGAEIMGRGKFGGGPGAWGDDPWPGWWGEDPPFHMPVFVLTHHEREPLTLSDTTFTFVTDGIESALEQARAAVLPADQADHRRRLVNGHRRRPGHPGVEGPRTARWRLLNAYIGRLFGVAHRDPVVAEATLKVLGMVSPPQHLINPRIAWRVRSGGRQRGLPVPDHGGVTTPPATRSATTVQQSRIPSGRRRPESPAAVAARSPIRAAPDGPAA